MIRWLAQIVLAVLFVGSLGLLVNSAIRIAQDPLVRPFVDSSIEQIAASSDRAMAHAATKERIATRLRELLADQPRNWLAINAVEGVALERGVALPSDLIGLRDALWDEDSGFFKGARDCATCAWDAGSCTLSNALICNAPISLSPVGDLIGVSRAGFDWITGNDVDRIDLGLSIIGLGATGAVLISGGSSLTLKLGAGTILMARRMRLLSPRLTGLLNDVMARGIDWQLVKQQKFSAPARLLRPDVVAPLAAMASDMGRIGRALPASETLHLLSYVDDAADARRLARGAEALGEKTLGRIELLGKARFMRTTVRVSNLALQTLVGLIGFLLAVAAFLGSLAQTLVLRFLRGWLRKVAA